MNEKIDEQTNHSIEQRKVSFDPRSLDASVLGGLDNAAQRAAVTSVVIAALRQHGINTRSFEGRHPLDICQLGAQIWPLVRYEVCFDGKSVEQLFRQWPAAGSPSLALAGLVKCLLAAVARRQQLRAELDALEIIGTIEQRSAEDPTIAVKKALSQVKLEPWMRGQREAS